MSLPVSIGECIELLKAAKAAYDAVQGVDDSVKEARHTIEFALVYVKILNKRLSNRKQASDPRELVELMIKRIKRVSVTADELRKLLNDFKAKIGPGGLEIRFDFINKAWFAGTKVKKMKEHLEELSKGITELDQGVSLFKLVAVENHGSTGTSGNKEIMQDAQKSLVKRDLSIIFLDADNTGRSKIAQGYAKLLREWTRQSGGHWPIKAIWSAGFNVSRRNECVDILSGKFHEKMIPSSEKHLTNPVASRALFENKLFEFPAKAKIRSELEESQSRGIGKGLFKEYDYLIVFTWRGKKQLENIRKTIAETYGQELLPKHGEDKGKIVLLSNFGGKDQRSIRDGGADEEQWKQVVPRIKLCFKAWLTEELGWKDPKLEKEN